MDMTVSEFQKSATEKVIAKLREFRGRQYADIRVYYLANITDNTYAPTKKGVTIAPDLLPELAKMVDELIAASGNTTRAQEEDST
jgi:hypothetical protein